MSGQSRVVQRMPMQRGPMGQAAPGEKAQTFGPSAKRLLGKLRTDMPQLIVVLVFGVLSVALSVIGREPEHEAFCERGIDDVPRHELGERGREVVDLDLLEDEVAREVGRTTERDRDGAGVVLGEGSAHLAELAAELLVTS